MRVYETKTRPAQEYRECVARQCDLCGKRAKVGDQWTSCGYDVDDTEVSVTVKHEHGSSYPEGRSTELWEVDVCPDCFRRKLLPWLQSQAISPIESIDTSW